MKRVSEFHLCTLPEGFDQNYFRKSSTSPVLWFSTVDTHQLYIPIDGIKWLALPVPEPRDSCGKPVLRPVRNRGF